MKKQIAKILSIALIMTLSVTSFAFAAVTLPSDVEKSNDKGLQQAVTGLIEAGAITGDTDGLFHPEQTLTRAQVCKMIVTLAEPIALNGTPTQPLKESFSDMAGSSWAAPYISYAADNGIALGYGDGKFKPTGNVTVAELVTFAVRACGYSDADLGGTWPQNYLKKAEEMKLFSEPADMAFVTETKTPAQMPEQMQKQQATKANAAMIIYNAMDKIKKDVAEDQPQGTDKDRLKDVPDTASMVYANASFSSDMTKYAGKDISKDAIVYTYAFKKDYAGDMKFSQKASDYRITTIDKYKLAKTQAWYNLENGKITEIVVPNDAGFTGYIYCVINATSARAVNAAGESVDVIDTFTAMKNIKWLGQKGLDKSAITAVGEGNVYELKAKDGVIINIAKTDAKLGKQFAELSGTSWATVLEKDGDTIKIKKSDLSEAWVILKSNTAIYNLDGSNKYETGRLSQIRKDTQVRLYDISDDKETSADIIVVK